MRRLSETYVEYGRPVWADETSRRTLYRSGIRKEFHHLWKGRRGDGAHVIQKLLDEYNFTTVADIGAGAGIHSKVFREHGKQVSLPPSPPYPTPTRAHLVPR